MLAEQLKADGAPKVVTCDLAREDMAEAVEDAFRYGRIVLATTTYNAGIFPFMHTFIDHLVERNWQNKTVALIENGTWAPMAAKIMKDKLSGLKNITFVEPTVKLMSAVKPENVEQIKKVSEQLTSDYRAQKEEAEAKHDPRSLFNIGYGLYVVTTNDGKKDNGCIVNAVTQLTSDPLRIAVAINKANYTYEVVNKTKKLNINCLSVEAPFSVFEQFGFVSGRDKDKFEGEEKLRSNNGLVFLNKYINSFISLKVEQVIDLGTHGLFFCSVEESRVISNKETMTYTYYQTNVKPKPDTQKKGWVCKVCGYVYEGENLPEDYVCPLCKHGAEDFEEIK